jgi:hypothetical protein
MAASIVMMIVWVVGTRVAFSLPMDLPANWTFRLVPAPHANSRLGSGWRSLMLLSFTPVWTASAAVCLFLWPPRQAWSHLAVLALVGLILVELCLTGFHKIPFTCAYLPGKSHVHMVTLSAAALLWLVSLSVRHERTALEDPLQFGILLAVLFSVLVCVAVRRMSGSQQPIIFDEPPQDGLLGLGLLHN